MCIDWPGHFQEGRKNQAPTYSVSDKGPHDRWYNPSQAFAVKHVSYPRLTATCTHVKSSVFCYSALTMRKEPFWLFEKTQRKISKNTLRRANCGTSPSPHSIINWFIFIFLCPLHAIAFKGLKRFGTSKGQFFWLSSRFKLGSNAFR